MTGEISKKAWHKWGWRVGGGAAILLFALLLTLRAGLWDRSPAPAGELPFSPATAAAGSETWLAITQEGRKIGYANRSLSGTKDGYRFSELLVMQINTMGIVQPLRVRTEATLNPDRTLADFHFELGSNLFGFTARGTVSGKELTVHLGTPGQEKTSRLTLAEAPYLGGAILDTLAALELKPGEGRTFPLFDPASLGQRPVRVTFLGEETLAIQGTPRPAKKFAAEFLGLKQTAWIDRDGTVLREEGMLGIVLERVGREAALAGLGGDATTDLVELVAIPSPRVIDRPGDLTLLRLRLKGVEADDFALAGGRQTYRDGLLTIRREDSGAPNRLPPDVDGDPAALLEPTPFIQSDHPRVQRQARDIVNPGDPQGVKARKIVQWVYESLEKRPVLSVPNALETLANRVGDCNEHAVLTAALARAAGIPAEVEAGLVYQRGRFYYHAWNALYLKDEGGWVTADATLGQFPADVTHIRFVRGGADRQLDLLGLIGRLQLDILEVVP
jgi:hypothetical protein